MQQATDILIQLSYLTAAVLFILALKWLSRPTSARRGVRAGEVGMLLAVVGTLLKAEVVSYEWIFAAFLLGSAIGVPLGMMQMTAVPQRTALSHAFGALAAALVGTSEYYLHSDELRPFIMAALAFEVVLGYLTFTGSLMAFGKLQDLLPSRPLIYRGQNAANLALFALAVGVAVYLVVDPGATALFPLLAALSLLFGVLLIIPIGGADMPTVISLLNSYAGLSAAAMGFVLDNELLIIAGALDGSSGFILSVIMCRAMNRSFTNVLFGGFGQARAVAGSQAEERTVRSASAEEAAAILESSSSVIVVPGYGMAVAQAQHKVRELYDALVQRGVEVTFAIHPVAGRMPGHMNVLLAEADIPYDRMLDLDEVNSEFPQANVALVIGANDVTNPAARSDRSSPIYGMPVLEVDKAASVMVIKRSMSPGFAGVGNDLYFMDKTLMLFGDAKSFVGDIIKELSGVPAGV
ncbi:MAG TPA: NAD(P)(+) transhydrogenase (Re/Si-specific) subunit beta [Egibacteraceae bacterium]|nr:NAD(P)(+) transhydrogenase (Re/Si-specific) subunit beta [Actinomycetota bacterium]HWB72999.1 NAD(P)(+) transhydrogenase (Re/Si-specific) subunit beta [Egibacteraceae bacterium]